MGCIELCSTTGSDDKPISKLVLLAVVFVIAYSAKECGQNEQYMECGTACEPKCNEPMPEICTMNCVVNVCQCKQGFKRGPSGCVAPGPDCK
ncbi:Trypsin Inhibitor like cysteine rich domain protein [Trichostrongylus colubriformis]|uniref:Trypsin Inhibitor like cysteine rich domain protein n=1 Tax=Trichostrongylus colubriformis TaxID=6319 RepID=A0AAN8FRM3_TRICO